MSKLLLIASIVLNLSGIAYAVVYVWLNSFTKLDDLSARNTGILKITKTALTLSLFFPLVSCLLGKSAEIEQAISSAKKAYTFVAISWMVIILICGAAMFYAFVSKSKFKEALPKSIKPIFGLALAGAIVGILLTWLLG